METVYPWSSFVKTKVRSLHHFLFVREVYVSWLLTSSLYTIGSTFQDEYDQRGLLSAWLKRERWGSPAEESHQTCIGRRNKSMYNAPKRSTTDAEQRIINTQNNVRHHITRHTSHQLCEGEEWTETPWRAHCGTKPPETATVDKVQTLKHPKHYKLWLLHHKKPNKNKTNKSFKQGSTLDVPSIHAPTGILLEYEGCTLSAWQNLGQQHTQYHRWWWMFLQCWWQSHTFDQEVLLRGEYYTMHIVHGYRCIEISIPFTRGAGAGSKIFAWSSGGRELYRGRHFNSATSFPIVYTNIPGKALDSQEDLTVIR